jgi:hypothetical protein
MACYALRCCAKTQKGTRCKLSNAFTGKFCHVHAPVEAEPEAPVVEDEEYNPCSKKFSPQAPEAPVAEEEAEVDAETKQFLLDFTEKIAETYGEPVDVNPLMEANTWDLILTAACVDKFEFKEALEWAVFEQLSLCKPGPRKFDFVFHKSFPVSLHKKVFSYQGDDLEVSLNQGLLNVKTSFVKK